MTRPATSARRRAREVAFRVAYQADVMGDTFHATWAARRDEEHLGPDPLGLVEDVVRTLETRLDDVDAAIRAAAEHWPLERLAATDRAVLRAAVAELIARPGTPARVVLDEAIELAKRYGSEESGRFVNGVLDHITRRVRAGEL
jgi:N utilization substance protein B